MTSSHSHPLATLLAVIIVLLAMLAPRLPGVGTHGMMQRLWLGRSETFVRALAGGDYAATYQGPHPGVTQMWVLGGAVAAAQPAAGADRVRVFEIAQVLWSTVLVLLLLWALRRALLAYGATPGRATATATLACVLVAISPWFIVMTQSANLDGPLTALALVAVCLGLTAIETGRVRDAALAGAAGGLAVLTKLPAAIFLAAVGIWLLLRAVRDRRARPRRVAQLIAFPLALIAVIVAGWPVLWVAPLRTVERLLLSPTEVAAVAARGVGAALEAPPATSPNYGTVIDALRRPHQPGNHHLLYGGITGVWQYYPAVLLFKTPPLSLLCAVIGSGLALWGHWRRRHDGTLRLLGGMWLCGALYFVGMSIAAKKTWRYMLPFEGFLELSAGLTIAWLLASLSARGHRWAVAALAGAVLVQSGHVLAHFPDFIGYYNPAVGGQAMAERFLVLYWGEGIGETARYIDAHAQRRPLRIRGQSFALSRMAELLGVALDDAAGGDAEFLVVTRRQVLRRGLSQPDPGDAVAEATVDIGGVPAIWIYRTGAAVRSAPAAAPPSSAGG